MTSPSLSLHLFKAKLTLHLAFLKLLLLAVASPSWVSHVPRTLLGASSLLSQQLWPVRNFCGYSWWSFISGVSLVSLDVGGGQLIVPESSCIVSKIKLNTAWVLPTDSVLTVSQCLWDSAWYTTCWSCVHNVSPASASFLYFCSCTLNPCWRFNSSPENLDD